MSMSIGLTKESQAAWTKALTQKHDEVVQGGSEVVEETVKKVEAEVSERIADENTNKGQLLQSIYSQWKGLKGEVGATAAHAPYVEWGTGPHRPPWDPIYEWVWLKRFDLDLEDEDEVYAFTYYLVEKIAKYGTKENLQWTDTLIANRKYFNDRMQEMLKKVLENA